MKLRADFLRDRLRTRGIVVRAGNEADTGVIRRKLRTQFPHPAGSHDRHTNLFFAHGRLAKTGPDQTRFTSFSI